LSVIAKKIAEIVKAVAGIPPEDTGEMAHDELVKIYSA
jgi:hypothetical protein